MNDYSKKQKIKSEKQQSTSYRGGLVWLLHILLFILLFSLLLVLVFLTVSGRQRQVRYSAELETVVGGYEPEDSEVFSVTRTEYVNEKGQVTFAEDKGYAARVTTKRDGKIVLEEFFDEKGRPAVLASGYSKAAREYDADGRVSVFRYLGATGGPVRVRAGYTELRRSYNEAGRADTDTYFDETLRNSSVKLAGGGGKSEYAGESAGHGGAAEQVSAETGAEDGGAVQVAHKDGYWQLKRVYEDGSRRVAAVRYLDRDGALINRTDGYAEARRTYNEDGKIETERYYDAAGAPAAVTSLGQYGYYREYDEQGRTVLTVYLGPDGEPSNTKKGYASMVVVYGDGDAAEEHETAAGDGGTDKPLANGGTKHLYYDVNGAPVTIGSGQYGLLRKDGQKYYLDADGEIMKRMVIFLGTHPYAVLVAGALLMLLAVWLRGRMRLVFLGLYMLFILYMTMVYREPGEPHGRFELFWSYRQFFSSVSMRMTVLNNIWLFVPFGAAVYASAEEARQGRKAHEETKKSGTVISWLRSMMLAVLLSLLFSLVIETVQYFAGIGLAEYDDLISNSLGGLIGAFAARALMLLRVENAG